MTSINTKRLARLLLAAALISWALHFWNQIGRPGIGWFEAAFGEWSMLPLSVVFALSLLIARIRSGTIADDPSGFYEKGVARYCMLTMVVAVSAALIFLGARPHLH